jgi:replicative DNA helicase
MSGVRTVAQGLREYASWANDSRPRVPWGLSFFDGPTGGGIARSETCMVLAYSSVGKTSLGLNVLRHNHEIPALFFSLEMSWRQVVSRLTAMEFDISTQDIEATVKEDGGFNRYGQHMADRFSRLVCDDTPAITLKQAKESFRQATETLGEPPRLVLWDYLERIGGTGLMNKAEAIDRAAEKMADWHRELDCSGIVLHQVGKGSDTGGFKPLSLDDGRYGGHQAMDYVVGAYAPRLDPNLTDFEYKQCQEELNLQLLKSRSGAASPVGKKHRQDATSMRVASWDSFVSGPMAPAYQGGFTP